MGAPKCTVPDCLGYVTESTSDGPACNTCGTVSLEGAETSVFAFGASGDTGDGAVGRGARGLEPGRQIVSNDPAAFGVNRKFGRMGKMRAIDGAESISRGEEIEKAFKAHGREATDRIDACCRFLNIDSTAAEAARVALGLAVKTNGKTIDANQAWVRSDFKRQLNETNEADAPPQANFFVRDLRKRKTLNLYACAVLLRTLRKRRTLVDEASVRLFFEVKKQSQLERIESELNSLGRIRNAERRGEEQKGAPEPTVEDEETIREKAKIPSDPEPFLGPLWDIVQALYDKASPLPPGLTERQRKTLHEADQYAPEATGDPLSRDGMLAIKHVADALVKLVRIYIPAPAAGADKHSHALRLAIGVVGVACVAACRRDIPGRPVFSRLLVEASGYDLRKDSAEAALSDKTVEGVGLASYRMVFNYVRSLCDGASSTHHADPSADVGEDGSMARPVRYEGRAVLTSTEVARIASTVIPRAWEAARRGQGEAIEAVIPMDELDLETGALVPSQARDDDDDDDDRHEQENEFGGEAEAWMDSQLLISSARSPSAPESSPAPSVPPTPPSTAAAISLRKAPNSSRTFGLPTAPLMLRAKILFASALNQATLRGDTVMPVWDDIVLRDAFLASHWDGKNRVPQLSKTLGPYDVEIVQLRNDIQLDDPIEYLNERIVPDGYSFRKGNAYRGRSNIADDYGANEPTCDLGRLAQSRGGADKIEDDELFRDDELEGYELTDPLELKIRQLALDRVNALTEERPVGERTMRKRQAAEAAKAAENGEAPADGDGLPPAKKARAPRKPRKDPHAKPVKTSRIDDALLEKLSRRAYDDEDTSAVVSKAVSGLGRFGAFDEPEDDAFAFDATFYGGTSMGPPPSSRPVDEDMNMFDLDGPLNLDLDFD